MISSNIARQRLQQSGLRAVVNNSVRCYISRAHPPESVPSFTINEALSTILGGVQDRTVKREQRWEKNKEKRIAKGIQDDGPYRNQNETIDLALNLNLDPRKPGQSLRGSTSLPNGTGKKISIVVFASNEDTVEAATDAGASVAGGTSLIESIARGEVPVNFDRALATPDMMSSLSKIARVLGPRGLMPNAKVNTIQPPDKIVDAIKEQASGSLQYRTDKNGVIHAGIGKGSFTDEELLENVKSFMNTIQSVKPESFGKGKKGKGNSKNAKYYLSAYLSSTQSKGSVKINLLTLDPTSAYFMGSLPE